MKYTIVICLLFTIIKSKENFPNKFIPTTLIGKATVGSGITNACEGYKIKDQCLAVKNPFEKLQCCFIQTTLSGPQNEDCAEYPVDLKEYEKITKTEKFMAFSNETAAFYFLEWGIPLSVINMNINCNNGQVNFDLLDKEYTDSEIETLKSETHCLRKKASKEKDHSFEVGKCEEGLVVDSSKKAGLECGYLVYNIKINKDKTLSYKTCDLFNYDLLSSAFNINSHFGDDNVEAIINNSDEYDSYQSFTVEVYNKKGQKIKYDSETGKFSYDIGYMITASKYLFLLMLILF